MSDGLRCHRMIACVLQFDKNAKTLSREQNHNCPQKAQKIKTKNPLVSQPLTLTFPFEALH